MGSTNPTTIYHKLFSRSKLFSTREEAQKWVSSRLSDPKITYDFIYEDGHGWTVRITTSLAMDGLRQVR